MSGGDWKDFYNAAESGNLPLVRYHLSAGIDPNYQHPEVMCSALVASLRGGHDAVTALLLGHGADPNLPAELGPYYPLAVAQSTGNAAMQRLLRQHGATAVPAAARTVWWQQWLPL